MGRKLYVGNLTYGVGDGDLQQMFEAFGTVQSAQVIMDRDTGRSKGFGFVEMGSDQEAQAAITGLNGKEHDGRAPLSCYGVDDAYGSTGVCGVCGGMGAEHLLPNRPKTNCTSFTSMSPSAPVWCGSRSYQIW